MGPQQDLLWFLKNNILIEYAKFGVAKEKVMIVEI